MQEAFGPRFQRWRDQGYRFKCSACNYILRDLTEWTRHIAHQRYPGCRNRPPQRGPYRAPLQVAQPPVVEAPVAEAPVVEAPVIEAPVVEAPVAEAPVVPVVQPVAVQPVVSPLPVSAPRKRKRKRKHCCDCYLCGTCPGELRFTFITCDHTLCTECVDNLFQAELRHPTEPLKRPRCPDPSCRKDLLDMDLRRRLPEEVKSHCGVHTSCACVRWLIHFV